jgi:membrane protein implicated in regulation of membrane protease activity
MDNLILWWHWIIFGILLLLGELLTGTFFILGLGVAALLVGIISLIFVVTFNVELFLWIILCIVAIFLWFKFIKDKTVSHTGQSNYRLDTLGVVTKDIKPGQRGEVLFEFPILGNTKWKALAKEPLNKGEKVKIIQIDGELVEVQKVKENQHGK